MRLTWGRSEDGRDGERRLVVRVDKNLTRGKACAAAVHAALMLLGKHPGTPVIVLGASREELHDNEVVVHDAGRTEVAPGTVTAGARWEWKP